MRNSFKFLAFKTNLGKKLRRHFLKKSNERELSIFTYYRYFFLFLISITIYATKRNGRYRSYQNDCWHWEKKSRELKRLQKISSQELKKKCSRVFFMKTQINSHLSQVGRAFFTQNFRNRRTPLASVVFNQMHNNFHFHEVFSQNSFKTFIEKIKRLKGQLPKSKKYSGMCNQHVSWKNTPLGDISVILFLKKLQ